MKPVRKPSANAEPRRGSHERMGSGTEAELRLEYATKRYLRAQGMHLEAEQCDERIRTLELTLSAERRHSATMHISEPERMPAQRKSP